MRSDNVIRIEQWTVQADDTKKFPSGKKVVTKIATRNSKGQFHGATNFRGSQVG